MNWKSYFSFKGRINRTQYFPTIFLLSIFSNNIDTDIGYIKSIFLYAVCIIFAIAGICLTVKRLHDIELPGTLVLLLLVPILSTLLIVFLIFIKGTLGPNRYGDDPLSFTFE